MHIYTVDAAYEGMQKRTFLAMSICIGCYLVILVGFLILYPKMAEQSTGQKEDEDDEEKEPILETDLDMKTLSDSDYMP